MNTTRKILILLVLSSLALPVVAADGNGIVETTYALVWMETDDFLRCGWNLARAPFEAARQDTVFVDIAQAVVDPVARGGLATARTVVDPAAGQADLLTDEGVEDALVEADAEARAAKCAITFYTHWAAYQFVWDNEGVNCYLEAFPTCATPLALCGVDTAIAYLLWPFEIWPIGTQDPFESQPDGPCMPPTRFNCVTASSPAECIPPPGPGRFRCAHTSTILGCVQEGI